MCWYTDFLFVISIKYDFKYLLSTYYSLKINCGLGVHWHLPPLLHQLNMTSHIYITINLFNLCQQSFFPFYIYFFKCWHRLNETFLYARLGDGAVLCDWVWRAAGVHTGFCTITFVLYIESLPNLAKWFPCGRGRTLFILGSLGQRSRSPLL